MNELARRFKALSEERGEEIDRAEVLQMIAEAQKRNKPPAPEETP